VPTCRSAVFIAVRGDGPQPRDLLAVIRREFVEIHGCIKGLAAEEKVPAPGYPAVSLIAARCSSAKRTKR
jgi:hypothetical protein